MTWQPISPRAVRYVKLGIGGAWERECRDEGILRFGFESGDPSSIKLCKSGRWEELALEWQKARKSKGRGTTDANEIKIYWTDPGDILWITFIGEDLCWGFLEPGDPLPYSKKPEADQSSYRRVIGGWKSVDRNGVRLGKSNLPGFITKVAAFRGTSCGVDRSERLVARINGERTADVDRVLRAREDLQLSLSDMIVGLGPLDFEILIDMIFSRSGWRRVGHIGRTARDKDLDLEMPLTGERAFVQVKTGATQKDLDDYCSRLQEMRAYSRMFFVYHSARSGLKANAGNDVTVLDASGVAKLAIESGLVDWIVDRVY